MLGLYLKNPYNRSQILQYVKYSLLNKLSLQNKLQNFVANNVFWTKNKKHNNNKTNKRAHKALDCS